MISTRRGKPRALDKDTVLSVLIPVFNEREALPYLHKRLIEVAAKLPVSVEFVLINDGSHDESLALMIKYARDDRRFRIVDLSRNFGHQLAISAGLSMARGDIVAILDADLQDPPENLAAMLERWAAGADIVYGRRRSRRGDSPLKRVTATYYYRLLSRIANVPIPNDTGDFRLVDRAVVDIINAMPERQRFLRGMFAWIGFRQEAFAYDRDPRVAGTTKYSLRSMIKFSLDGILSFSVKPLRWMVTLGICMTILAFFSGIYLLLLRLFSPESFSPGFAGMFIAMLFMFGVNFVCLGVIGEYIGRSYVNIQGRPPFIIRSVYQADGAEHVSLRHNREIEPIPLEGRSGVGD